MFGDGEYTPREAFVDASTGLIGGSLLKPAGSVLWRGGKAARHVVDDISKGLKHTVDDLVWVGGYIAAPAVSKPVQKEYLGGWVAGYVYDHFKQSSGSSSESYQQNGGPGGKRKPYPLPHYDMERSNVRNGKVIHDPCEKGYVARKVRGKWMCVPVSRKGRKK